MNINIECTFCEHDIEVPLQWAVTNGRVYCPCCSKSFDVKVELPEVAVDLAKEDTVDETVVTEVKVPVEESEETVNKDSEEEYKWKPYSTDDYDWSDVPF